MRKPASALLVVVAALAAVPAFAQSNCPTINGKFFLDTILEGEPKRATFTLHTRVTGGVHSYTVGGASGVYQTADGITRPVKIGNRSLRVTMRCSGQNTLEREILFEDTNETSWVKLTPFSEDHLRVEMNVAERNGLYLRDKR